MKLNDKIYIAGHCGLVGSAIVRQYKERGFVVLAFPSNDFRQELSNNEEIKDFIERLFSHKDHSFCPLGKPIMQTKSLEELTSNF